MPTISMSGENTKIAQTTLQALEYYKSKHQVLRPFNHSDNGYSESTREVVNSNNLSPRVANGPSDNDYNASAK